MTNTDAATANNFDFDLFERVTLTTRHGVVTGYWAGEVKINGSHHVMLNEGGIQHTYAAHTVSAVRA